MSGIQADGHPDAVTDLDMHERTAPGAVLPAPAAIMAGLTPAQASAEQPAAERSTGAVPQQTLGTRLLERADLLLDERGTTDVAALTLAEHAMLVCSFETHLYRGRP